MSYDIKQLEWGSDGYDHITNHLGVFGYYRITPLVEGKFIVWPRKILKETHDTLEAAKAAAQSHYEAGVSKHLVESEVQP